MNRKNRLLQILSGIWISSLLLLIVSGCSDEYGAGWKPNEKTVSVTLDLLMPGVPAGAMNTRSMGLDQEIAIGSLQVLIFEETAPDKEVFRQAVSQNFSSQVTLELQQSESNYRFVVLANAPAQTIADGTPKEDALNKFTFDVVEKWATSGDASLIPMWGEHKETISVKNDRSISVRLCRALARVDVGLKFKPQTKNDQTEEVLGLDNFKIKSVRVYRTKNKAYAATSADRMNAAKDEVITPHIPADAKFNPGNTEDLKGADANPLVYELTAGADSYIREIYIPESAIYGSATPCMDETPCLVIGGYYGETNTTEETFYRADFAAYSEGKVEFYRQVLRNHRYVFDIKAVGSSGFKEPEQALNSITTGMNLTVEAWNDVALNTCLQGDYFFQIETREVWLEAAIWDEGGYEQAISSAVSYRTNIDFIEEPKYPGDPDDLDFKRFKNVKWTWSSTNSMTSAYYKTYFLPEQNLIYFVANDTNVGKPGNPADQRHDVMTLTVENMRFTIDVYQKAANLEYNLLCGFTKVHGKYREGVPLNYTHYLEMQIEFSQSPSAADIIEIASETRKGINFRFEGTTADMEFVSAQKYRVKLQGRGTPEKDLNDPVSPDKADGALTPIYALKITANTINTMNGQCRTDILFGYKTKRILAIGANAGYRYGYTLEPNTGSRAFVDACVNFGVDPNSTVTMEQFKNDYRHPGNYSNKSDATAIGNAFHIEYMTAGRGMAGESINETYLNTMLSEFKPDIILTGQAINFTHGAIALIADFVDKGGVMLMFNEYYPSAASINKMASAVLGVTVSGENQALSESQFFFKLPTVGFDDDPILNGSFGDLRGLQWGTDGYFLHGFSGLPSDIAVYSTRPNNGNPCFFRYTGKPFVFIGDGGFLSNAQRYIGPSYQGMRDYCPFAINSAYQPIARTNLLGGGYGSVDNSKLFGNILAWAVDYAEFHGINAK